VNRVHDCIGYAITPPTQNPTTPGVPTAFAVTPLLGVLRFDLGEPLIRPLGMHYQILRSPGTLAVAGSYSVIWEGDVTQAVLPSDPRSVYWYHGRAVTNSYFSLTAPDTFGIASAPFIAPESVPGNRGYSDGELFFASNSYWTSRQLQSFTSYSLVTSGGVTDQRGRLLLSATSGSIGGANMYVMPARFDVNSRVSFYGVPMMPLQTGIAYITARRVSSAMPQMSWRGIALHVNSPKEFPTQTTLWTGPITSSMAAANSGDWVTFIQTFTMPGSFYDHFMTVLRFNDNQSMTDGPLEVGALQVSVS